MTDSSVHLQVCHTMSIMWSKIAVQIAICWFSDPVIVYAKDLKRQLPPSTIICFTVGMSGGVRLTLGLPGGTVLPLKLNIMQELPQH